VTLKDEAITTETIKYKLL